MRKTLYRAAQDDSMTGARAFAASKSAAMAYMSNGAFGGPILYRAVVEIDPATVLDLLDAKDPMQALLDAADLDHPGAVGPDELVMFGHVTAALAERGYRWVRVLDSFPADCETWVWLGESDAQGNDPELEPVSGARS